MDRLHDRLAELAEEAPTGGAPAAELWARGKRAHRFRVAGVAAAVLVVGAVGAGIGVRVVDGNGDRSVPEPVGPVVVALPIEYPVGRELPDLGDAPGPLAGIWLTPHEGGGGALEAVGLVAETGRFGTLPIDVSRRYMAPDAYFALSPDGRRIAYDTAAEELVVHDLVSGESYSPTVENLPRPDKGYTWVDSTHLVGHVALEGRFWQSEADGWLWQPGTAPQFVDLMEYPGSPYLGPHAGVYEHPWFGTVPEDEDPRQCLSIQERPVLCDVVGVIGPEIALTHDGDGAVVALDAKGVENPALRDVVATAGAPLRVTFATDLIGQSLDAEGGVS